MKIIFFVAVLIATSEAFLVENTYLPEKLSVDDKFYYNPEPEPVPEIAFNAEKDVRFLLFTRSNPTGGQRLDFRELNSLRNSNYNATFPTCVLIHGFQSDEKSDINILVTAAYLRHSENNVIVGKFNVLNLKQTYLFFKLSVDWSVGSKTINYLTAKNRVKDVGSLLAQQLDFLHEAQALNFSRLILAGHSLGGEYY